jgi:N utilization substance protein A
LEKILDIINSIAYEKGLSIESVRDGVKEALISTAKKVINEDFDFDVEIDEKNKRVKLFKKITVVGDDDERAEDYQRYIPLDEAKDVIEDIEVGDFLEYEEDLENYGRTAINSLYRELEHKIQRLVEEELYKKYADKKGKIVTGNVVRVDSNENTYIEIDEVRAILPKKSRIKGEVFKVGDVVKSILSFLRIDKNGIQIELSRTTPKFLTELLRLEVPEIKDGIIKVEKCARIPGVRAKVAVSTTNPKLDPVGSVVGVKGMRISAVSEILNGENIDCLEYIETPEILVSRALSPAIIKSVKIDDKKAIVSIPSDQKSKAIGKSGVNIRLVSMITNFEIELLEQDSGIPTPTDATSTADATRTQDLSSLANLFKSE